MLASCTTGVEVQRFALFGEAALREECYGVQGGLRTAMMPLIVRLLTLLASVRLSVGNLSDVQSFLLVPCARTN